MARLMAGKPKGKAGRPKMSVAERLEGSQVHIAAIEVQVIRRGLQELYPEQAISAVRARAMEIAAERTGVDPEKLRQHLNRARSDRHRLG